MIARTRLACWTPLNCSRALGELPSLPVRAGLSHMVQKLDEKGIVPPCTLDFSAHRSGARVGAEDVEDEPAQDGQVLRGVVFSRSAAALVQDDIEHPMQLILDGPMRTLDAQQRPGRNVLREQEVAYDRRLGAAIVHPSARGDARHCG